MDGENNGKPYIECFRLQYHRGYITAFRFEKSVSSPSLKALGDLPWCTNLFVPKTRSGMGKLGGPSKKTCGYVSPSFND